MFHLVSFRFTLYWFVSILQGHVYFGSYGGARGLYHLSPNNTLDLMMLGSAFTLTESQTIAANDNFFTIDASEIQLRINDIEVNAENTLLYLASQYGVYLLDLETGKSNSIPRCVSDSCVRMFLQYVVFSVFSLLCQRLNVFSQCNSFLPLLSSLSFLSLFCQTWSV